MQYRTLGKTNLRISEIGFGAWAIGGGMWATQSDDDSIAALNTALDLGVNFIDTAAGYGNGRSEQVIAKVLKARRSSASRSDLQSQDELPSQGALHSQGAVHSRSELPSRSVLHSQGELSSRSALDSQSALSSRIEPIIVATKIPPTPGAWPPTPFDRADDRYPETYLREKLEERLRFLETDCIDLLQLHVWTRAWNRDPSPLRTLEKFKKEGKLRFVGLSTNDYDQDDCTSLFSTGVIDTIQLIYNLFEQNPAAEALPTALAHGVGVIVRVPFDEGSLTGKFTAATTFPEGDFRNRYFGGDRLERTIKRVEKIKPDLEGTAYSMPQAALKFILSNPAVSVVIPGMRNAEQAKINVGVSDLPKMSDALVAKLRKHSWSRGNWYAGK